MNILGNIGVFGPRVIKKLNWPTVEYFHLVDFPFLLLEQAGLFFLIAWYASIFVTIATGAAVIGNEFQIIFPGLKRQWITIAYCISLLVLVNLPIDMITLENFFMRTQKGLAFSFLSFFLVTWVVNRVRFGKKSK